MERALVPGMRPFHGRVRKRGRLFREARYTGARLGDTCEVVEEVPIGGGVVHLGAHHGSKIADRLGFVRGQTRAQQAGDGDGGNETDKRDSGRRALMARIRRWHAQIEAARISISSSLSRGMMLTGNHFDESRIYRAAHAFEQSGDWMEM